MFGPFRPTPALSGGLLWKIPWRMSAHQKLRQRRRLRRVDNVIAVLDTALQRQKSSLDQQRASKSQAGSSVSPPSEIAGVSQEDLNQTAEGQRLLAARSLPISQAERRHGLGPKKGEFLPPTDGDVSGTPRLLGDEAKNKGTFKQLERWKIEMPSEGEMLPRDKYTMFDRKAKGYRKGVHKLPKWTKVSQRLNPPGF